MDGWKRTTHKTGIGKNVLRASSVTRREVAASLVGLGAGLLSAGSATAQPPGSGPRRFDLHHHFGSPNWIRIVNEMKALGYQRWQTYSPAKSIEDMNQGGVAMSFLSLTTPGVWFGVAEQTRR